jgi:hypothetical protein
MRICTGSVRGEGYVEYCSCCDEVLNLCSCSSECHTETEAVKKECYECEESSSYLYGRFIVNTDEGDVAVVDFDDDRYYEYSQKLMEFLNEFFYGQLYWELVRPSCGVMA